MASYAYDPGTGKARVFFRFRGRQFNKTVKVGSDRAAARLCAIVEETVSDLERGKLTLPESADAGAFLLSGGKVTATPAPARTQPAVSDSFQEHVGPLTLGRLFDRYQADLTPDSKEANSLATERVHARHFRRVLGADRPLPGVDLAALQRYADERCREGVGRATVRKELSTLRVVWGWASNRGHVPSPPGWKMRDLTFPKAGDKPPFQTWDQITRRVERGGLTGDQEVDLWECLWLDQGQTVECLAWVRENARRAVMHPMFAFAAYTGARRSEMIRSEREDRDFAAGTVTVRQKKADRSKTFTRRDVPIHPALAEVMTGWFRSHPGGPWAVCMPDGRPLIPQTASELLRLTLRGGRWSVLHGWHVFRHSLASNMAAAGVDQRDINAILGHSTAEMERRYRHLCPRKQAHALGALFRGETVGTVGSESCGTTGQTNTNGV